MFKTLLLASALMAAAPGSSQPKAACACCEKGCAQSCCTACAPAEKPAADCGCCSCSCC